MLGRFRAWYQDEGYTLTPSRRYWRVVRLVRLISMPYESGIALPYPGSSCSTGGGDKRVSNILAKSDEVLSDRVNPLL